MAEELGFRSLLTLLYRSFSRRWRRRAKNSQSTNTASQNPRGCPQIAKLSMLLVVNRQLSPEALSRLINGRNRRHRGNFGSSRPAFSLRTRTRHQRRYPRCSRLRQREGRRRLIQATLQIGFRWECDPRDQSLPPGTGRVCSSTFRPSLSQASKNSVGKRRVRILVAQHHRVRFLRIDEVDVVASVLSANSRFRQQRFKL